MERVNKLKTAYADSEIYTQMRTSIENTLTSKEKTESQRSLDEQQAASCFKHFIILSALFRWVPILQTCHYTVSIVQVGNNNTNTSLYCQHCSGGYQQYKHVIILSALFRWVKTIQTCHYTVSIVQVGTNNTNTS